MWTFILTIVISILCGLVANLGTPVIKQFLTNKAPSRRKAKLIRLKDRLEYFEYLDENRESLNSRLLMYLILMFTITLIGFSLLCYGWLNQNYFERLSGFWLLGGATGIGLGGLFIY